MAPRSEDPKIIIRVIDFELVQPICPRYVNVTDRQTDGRTDGRTTYDSNTALALRASRGKNGINNYFEKNAINVDFTVTVIQIHGLTLCETRGLALRRVQTHTDLDLK